MELTALLQLKSAPDALPGLRGEDKEREEGWRK